MCSSDIHTEAFQCIYGYSDERGENGDREEGSETHGGGERMEITSCTQMTCFCVVSQRRT